MWLWRRKGAISRRLKQKSGWAFAHRTWVPEWSDIFLTGLVIWRSQVARKNEEKSTPAWRDSTETRERLSNS
ncbi:hypothetical protein DPV78_011094 [Talaromyces pinophilus]|nr:hypothetical protein DPV78_011094 [Talaromyces pinophilus]